MMTEAWEPEFGQWWEKLPARRGDTNRLTETRVAFRAGWIAAIKAIQVLVSNERQSPPE